ncbi:Arginine--tRNA ligase [Frankliniella fusca]|uniref:Arginine--tRNA ligase n=1 Tax=Frankliniella fusca TaxID=407009 RepID=A0AAE1HFM4_9NEOP|nr:Arginine--tRNA ligase [Frankliniella fusca]
MSKLDQLLGKLSYAFPSVPKSYKTLLGTATNIDILNGINFKLWYKGIKVNLDQMDLNLYLQRFGRVKIDINMDGLPLSKTGGSKLKFWPTLGKLKETENEPFIIALYCGETDPRDIDLFMGDLTLELHSLYQNGYDHQGENHAFEVENFILDAPARSLVKCCVQHGGYGACEKCDVRGVYVADRMSYAVVGPEVRLRTDASFANQEDRFHHNGVSPLTMINEIGLVSNFRLDTMHLVYKGAFLRLGKLLGFIVSCPEDFNRKPRKIEEFYKYKATELRRLLLYDGVVAFKDEMEDNIHRLFCLLHCAIYILASRHLLANFHAHAEVFLRSFVQYSAEVFSNHFVVYNIHSLLHLTDECRVHGVLENFSAFCFENHLKSIKETLKSGYLPLEQIVKRDSERSINIPVHIKGIENSVQLSHQHIDPCEQENGDQFKKIIVNNVVFKIGRKNGCFITNDKRVAVLKNIVQRDQNTVCFIGHCFTSYENLYDYPINSSDLGIFIASELNLARETFPLQDIVGKSWLLEIGNKSQLCRVTEK